MSKRFVFLFVVLIMMTISVHASLAQNTDISNMDNAQLMQLLQAIMQKLESSEGSGIEEAGGRIFRVYENKKLMLERLPDYMFYQAPAEEPDTEKEKDKEEIKIYTEPTFGKPCGTGVENGKVIYIPWSYCCETCPLSCGCG